MTNSISGFATDDDILHSILGLYRGEIPLNLIGVTALSDGWLVTTDNTSGSFDTSVEVVQVTLPNKTSPKFLTDTTISPNAEWPLTGWKTSAMTGLEPWKAFDKTLTYWWSSGFVFDTAGLPTAEYTGGTWLKIQFPQSQQVATYTISTPSLVTSMLVPSEWRLEGSNDDQNFQVIETYTKTYWLVNQVYEFSVPTHSAYKYWRFYFTKKNTNNSLSAIALREIEFSVINNTVYTVTTIPVSLNTFKIQVFDTASQTTVNMITQPYSYPLQITLSKNGKVVNKGQYTLTSSALPIEGQVVTPPPPEPILSSTIRTGGILELATAIVVYPMDTITSTTGVPPLTYTAGVFTVTANCSIKITTVITVTKPPISQQAVSSALYVNNVSVTPTGQLGNTTVGSQSFTTTWTSNYSQGDTIQIKANSTTSGSIEGNITFEITV